jgi:hypothetical protein
MRRAEVRCAAALVLSLACASGAFGTLGCASGAPATREAASSEFGAPVGRVVEQPRTEGRDVIAYRRLVRSDFKASAPPPEFALHRDQVGAATCGLIEPAPGTSIRVRSIAPDSTAAAAGAGGQRFVAWVPGLRFRALMDRACSWWNPDSGQAPDYVLEHEQIHFAIFELTTRDLNRRATRLEAALRSEAPTLEAARDAAQRKFRDELGRALQASLERSTRFDRETSFSYDPARQREWAEQVERELEASASDH